MIWYNCASCDSDSISDWDNFSIFDLFQIVSACRLRNACACLIFIELFINRASFHSFFFSFLSLCKLMCADTRMASLVYYENDSLRVLRKWLLVYYEAFVRWLYIDSESFIKTWCSRFACNTPALRQYFNILLPLFMTFWFWKPLSFFAVMQ